MSGMSGKHLLRVFGDAFYKRHHLVFRLAAKHGLSLCGSCAPMVVGKKSGTPNDIDFVCGANINAGQFIAGIHNGLARHKCHYRVYVNNRNAFVPKRATAHVRITSSLWLPVCVFTVPESEFFMFYGVRVQRLDLVRDAAKELEAVDGKPRLAASIDEDAEGLHAAQDDEPQGNFYTHNQ